LGTSTATFDVEWYDPQNGGALATGSVLSISGPGQKNIGSPPFNGDAVALVKLTNVTPPPRPGMTFPGADWQEATPETLGVDSTKMEIAFSYLSQYLDVSSTAVVRNGYLIRKSPSIDSRFGTFSCTKSYTSTVLGLLSDDGRASLDTLAKDYVLAMAPDYPAVTLKHFATMTSGYDAQGTTYDIYDGSTTPFTPTTPLFTPPGSKFAYFDDAMNEFGNVLTQIAQEPIYNLFKRRIADPIGMTDWGWPNLGVVNGYVVYEGSGNQTGINISARQMARLGHLFLNRGNWNGVQLLSASWVDQATSNQVPVSIPHSGIRATLDGRGVYGFSWWVNGIKVDGTRKWPSAPLKTFTAWGIHDNHIWVIPEWNMVITRTGDGVDVSDAVWDGFLSRLSAAVTL
jgi:CubicO group peptidase (beta-lactamase class C family)